MLSSPGTQIREAPSQASMAAEARERDEFLPGSGTGHGPGQIPWSRPMGLGSGDAGKSGDTGDTHTLPLSVLGQQMTEDTRTYTPLNASAHPAGFLEEHIQSPVVSHPLSATVAESAPSPAWTTPSPPSLVFLPPLVRHSLLRVPVHIG